MLPGHYLSPLTLLTLLALLLCRAWTLRAFNARQGSARFHKLNTPRGLAPPGLSVIADMPSACRAWTLRGCLAQSLCVRVAVRGTADVDALRTPDRVPYHPRHYISPLPLQAVISPGHITNALPYTSCLMVILITDCW